MARYIDADKFEQTIKGKELFQGYFDNGFIYDELHRQPTADVVEVPCRCGKCRYGKLMGDKKTYVCIRQTAFKEKDDYCSRGKRRDT